MPSILVVEDDAAMRGLLLKVLRQNGFAVAEASDGREAVGLLASGTFDLILSDIRMSPVNGLGLASQAKELSPAPMVLLMTAYGEENGAREARTAGADGYMSKPFAMNALLRTVCALLKEGARGRAPDVQKRTSVRVTERRDR
jgi:two-component system response regulator HydG